MPKRQEPGLSGNYGDQPTPPLPLIMAAFALLIGGFWLYFAVGYLAAGAAFVGSGFLCGTTQLAPTIWRSKLVFFSLVLITIALGVVTHAVISSGQELGAVIMGAVFGFPFGQLLGMFARVAVAGATGKLDE